MPVSHRPMDANEYILSAGRVVLGVVERGTPPLAPGELELRRDQAVEEILEAELVAQIKTQPPPTAPPAVYLQILQNHTTVQQQVSQTTTTTSAAAAAATSSQPEEPEPREPGDALDGAAVQHIADLLQGSKSQARLAGRARLSLSHTVLLSLTLLSNRVSYRSVSRRFHLEKGNIHRIFFSFCERVNLLEKKMIRWPADSLHAPLLVSSPEEHFQEGVPRVLGVLGHICIPIRLPIGKHDVESHVLEVKRMKKEAHPDSWLNLQLICDHVGRFIHCRISKGSDPDRGGALRDELNQQPDLMPPDCCLVARPSCPLTKHILTPYSSGCGAREELFNKTLEEHLHILDQAVADLRARFKRLRYLDIGNYDRARAVVLTACVLHNVYLDMGHVVRGEVKKEGTQEEEGEADHEGVCGRDGIADLLFKNFGSSDG